MDVVRGCIFMTDAARQRYLKSRAPPSRTDLTSASRATLRCGRTPGAGLLHLAAPSLPLPRTGSATEGAGSPRPIETGIHRETSRRPDSAGPGVRHKKTIVPQRGGQPGVARGVAARARAWVSRDQRGREPAAWSTDWIVGCRTNWHRHISCWCRTKGGPLAESAKGRLHPQNRLRRSGMNQPAAMYAGMSSDRQKENHPLASQPAALVEYAQTHGYSVPPEWVFPDEG